MTSRIPDIHEVSQALWYEPEETGFKVLGEWLGSFRTENAQDLHTINVHGDWSIATVRKLVQLRIEALEESLAQNKINLRDLWNWGKLKEKVREKSGAIVEALWPVWTKRFNTRTATVKSWNEITIVDISEGSFKNADSFDYSKIVDGWARFKNVEEMWEVYSRIPLSVYMAAKWGNRSILELYKHPVVMALIPDIKQRNKYLSSLGALDLLDNFELWSQSIWVPAWFEDGGGRFYALGKKADAFYPPNFTTKYMELLLHKKSN